MSGPPSVPAGLAPWVELLGGPMDGQARAFGHLAAMPKSLHFPRRSCTVEGRWLYVYELDERCEPPRYLFTGYKFNER